MFACMAEALFVLCLLCPWGQCQVNEKYNFQLEMYHTDNKDFTMDS